MKLEKYMYYYFIKGYGFIFVLFIYICKWIILEFLWEKFILNVINNKMYVVFYLKIYFFLLNVEVY